MFTKENKTDGYAVFQWRDLQQAPRTIDFMGIASKILQYN